MKDWENLAPHRHCSAVELTNLGNSLEDLLCERNIYIYMLIMAVT